MENHRKNKCKTLFLYIFLYLNTFFLFLLRVSLYKRQLDFSILNIRSILILFPPKKNVRIRIAIAALALLYFYILILLYRYCTSILWNTKFIVKVKLKPLFTKVSLMCVHKIVRKTPIPTSICIQCVRDKILYILAYVTEMSECYISFYIHVILNWPLI